MFTLEIKWEDYHGNIQEKFYCKPKNKICVFSEDVRCAKLFKSIAGAKRAFNSYIKKYDRVFLRTHGYSINMLQLEKCSLCRQGVPEAELDKGYEVAVCSRCSRSLAHYGSE